MRIGIGIGAPLALIFSQSLAALEPMNATALVSACKSYQSDSQSAAASSCRAFIQGYLSASNEIVAAGNRPSEFVARAIRTRASRLSDAAEQRLNSRYCLPEGETLEKLIAKVAAEDKQFALDAEAAVVMRRVFDGHYLCDAAIQS
ncbi:Rap1a/Tai family immunity protein [Microbulbifer donghaiensis]|nr:Rap1a/Tai family immunity protein [Microbulbifer donghaiensis]